MRFTLCLCLLLPLGCDDDPSADPELDAAPTPDAAVTPDPDAAPPEPDAAVEEPLPEVTGVAPAEDHDPTARVVEYHLTAAAMQVAIADDRAYPGYAYNGQVPGPLLQARVGDEVVVHFTNDLPEPTTIHWHGMRVPNDMDGNPRIQRPVRTGQTFTYRFTATDPGTYWYHPHVRTQKQMERGLYGPFVIHRADEPAYDEERVLVLDDILLDGNDELPPFLRSHPEQMHGRYGNVLLTNGRADAVVGTAKQGQVELWRVMNNANARTMVLDVDGAEFRVVGTDGGPLATPYETDELLVPVGQRYDLEVRYTGDAPVTLRTHVPTDNGAGGVEWVPLTAFQVDVEASDDALREVTFLPGAEVPLRLPNRDEELVFDAVNGANGIEWRMNGESMPMEPLYTFAQGDTVTLRLVNRAGPEHPFHLHGQFFTIVADGRPATEQPGLKDTVLVPGMSTVVVTAFVDNPGQWMAHCHILAHAELGMMSEFIVEPAE